MFTNKYLDPKNLVPNNIYLFICKVLNLFHVYCKKRQSQFVLLYLYATKCWERKKEW